MTKDEKFIARCIKLAENSVKKGESPFGSLITLNNKIIAESGNMVFKTKDVTQHAEMRAILAAQKKFKSSDLSKCTIYTNCEPCPMCMGAIFWSRLDKVYYANTKNDAKNIDFDDSFIYQQIEIDNDKKEIPFIKMNNSEAIKAFEKWDFLKDKIKY